MCGCFGAVRQAMAAGIVGIAVVFSGTASADDTQQMEANSSITAVTVYPTRASVTRQAQLDLQPGVYDVVFTPMPESIQSQTIQARPSGDARILSLDYEQRLVPESGPRDPELEAPIQELKQAIARLKDEIETIEEQQAFLTEIRKRAAQQAADATGTGDLNLEALQKQIEFLGTQRDQLLKRQRTKHTELEQAQQKLQALEQQRNAGSGDRQRRQVTVQLAVQMAGEQTVDLTYLVSNAAWAPRYNLRSSQSGTVANRARWRWSTTRC